ncbi:MAG: peptidylprolyl isomerase [Oscillospiraceae bacterium]|nr:peptidylprolyl isomerase [Oscillospiraceae bacterium]
MKMNKTKKLLSAALCVTLAAAMLAGCGQKVETMGGSSTPSPESVTSTPPAKDPGLYIDGTKTEIDTVMTLGEHKVSFDEYRYFFMNILRQAQSTGAVDVAELKSGVEASLRSNAAMLALVKEKNITLSAQDKEKVEKEMADMKARFPSEDEYYAALSSAYYTEDLLRTMMEDSLLVQNLTLSLYKDDIIKNVAENYVHAKHILISFPEEAAASASTSTSTPPADHSAELAKANEVMDKIKAGESFEELIKTYNQDPGAPEEGYYFTTGRMVKPFEDAAFALKDGEVSDIVETNYGYHIIKRYPFEEEVMFADPMTYMSDAAYEAWVSEITLSSEAMPVEYHELYEKITPDTMA